MWLVIGGSKGIKPSSLLSAEKEGFEDYKMPGTVAPC
jgi:hypothetical protein